jgi:hypothetical protein
LLDDAGVISPDGIDAGLISVVGTHLFVLVLTDDAGLISVVAHLFVLVLTDDAGLISVVGTHLFVLVLTDDAGIFFECHGSLVPPNAYGLRTSPGPYHGSPVPPDAYGGLRTSPFEYHGSSLDAYDGPGNLRDSGDNS